ncbi:MAG: hypothetical protein M1833_004782 [Piccolia ochrophora]|nr:MAG: hypothetical protein M1833_004782 [Piccolia ochrophora]
MRLFLVPVSTRRTLIYCQRINQVTSEKPTLVDRATGRANGIWRKWEKSERGWQKKVVDYGNKVFERISFAEWGLKSIPPLSARRRAEELSGKEKVDVIYPENIVRSSSLNDLLRKLATERQPLHRKRMWGSMAAMPITLPVGLIPIIPNLPFLYLVFRAWSHWRALSGSKHLEFLHANSLITLTPSSVLSTLYASPLPVPSPSTPSDPPQYNLPQPDPPSSTAEPERIILHHPLPKDVFADTFDVPELGMEIERAIRQVERKMAAAQELESEKKDIRAATGEEWQDPKR